LALAQANEVRARLASAHPELAEELAEIGGKGLFTKEIEEALVAGRIDAAVHSMKDVPTWLPEGLEISTILPREDPRDGLLSAAGQDLAGLPAGAVVGTASLRRQAQVLLARPDLKVIPFRGNVQTRLRKLAEGQVDATLLAMAGLKRLGMSGKVSAVLAPEDMLPAVAQGAIGLEIRGDDAATRGFLAALDDPDSAVRVAAERACLEVLDGSCRTPIAAFAEFEDDGATLRLRALVALPDGSQAHRAERRGSPGDAVALGCDAGEELRAAAGPEFFATLGLD